MKTKKFEFRGGTYEVDADAARSMRVQRDISLVGEPGHAAKGWESFDKLFCGHLDEYLDRIPGEDGAVGEYGCTGDDFVAFVQAASESADAKN